MAVPGSAAELQPPQFVCESCGALFHHVPDRCGICQGSVIPRPGATTDAPLDRRRRRILITSLALWTLVLVLAVARVAFYDPAQGRAGRIVYPSEAMLESVRHGEPQDAAAIVRTFRLSRRDRIERVAGPAAANPDDVWIHIKSGPHAGRTGVISW